MVGICPHCGQPIELLPEVGGATLVVDAEEKAFAVLYKTGFALKKRGRLIHVCEKTGKDGHIVRS